MRTEEKALPEIYPLMISPDSYYYYYYYYYYFKGLVAGVPASFLCDFLLKNGVKIGQPAI